MKKRTWMSVVIGIATVGAVTLGVTGSAPTSYHGIVVASQHMGIAPYIFCPPPVKPNSCGRSL